MSNLDDTLYDIFPNLTAETTKGGSGSGNFGHAGRPGKRGGSSSESPKTFQPRYLKGEDRWVVGSGGNRDFDDVTAEINKNNEEIKKKRDLLTPKKPKKEDDFTCMYCGQPAEGFGFFDEPACSECGGR